MTKVIATGQINSHFREFTHVEDDKVMVQITRPREGSVHGEVIYALAVGEFEVCATVPEAIEHARDFVANCGYLHVEDVDTLQVWVSREKTLVTHTLTRAATKR